MREVYWDGLLGTASDAAFVTGLDGIITYANRSAGKLLAVPTEELPGCACYRVVQGVDHAKLAFCRASCAVRELAGDGVCPDSFDLQIHTANGPRWVHLTLLLASRRPHSGSRQVIHLMHDVQVRVELEDALREFLKRAGTLTGQELEHLLSFAPAPHPPLTAREKLVLDCLARGCATRVIAWEIGVSVPTVRNHIQAVLRKLSAHSRLEAVMRALQEKQV